MLNSIIHSKTELTHHLLFVISTMRQKFSNFSNQIFFMIKYAKVFDMRFIGRVLHNFTFITSLHTFLTSTVCHAKFNKSC